jgi:hypothetical protein
MTVLSEKGKSINAYCKIPLVCSANKGKESNILLGGHV